MCKQLTTNIMSLYEHLSWRHTCNNSFVLSQLHNTCDKWQAEATNHTILYSYAKHLYCHYTYLIVYSSTITWNLWQATNAVTSGDNNLLVLYGHINIYVVNTYDYLLIWVQLHDIRATNDPQTSCDYGNIITVVYV